MPPTGRSQGVKSTADCLSDLRGEEEEEEGGKKEAWW